MLTIIAFLFVLTLVVCAHETGHFWAAKRAGIGVKEFGLGMGPTIWSFTRRETKYSLHLFPIGGFVLLSGLDEEKDSPAPDPQTNYYSKPIGLRSLTILMGPLFNILLALVIFILTFSLIGVPTKLTNIIGQVVPGSEAEKIGLKAGDEIISLAGQPVSPDTMEEAIKKIHQSGGQTLALVIKRDDQTLRLKATPRYDEARQIALIGFSPKFINERYGPVKAIYYGFWHTFNVTVAILMGFKLLLMGKIGFGGLAGPLGIAQLSGQAAQQGLATLLNFTAFLSVNLAIINLLPFPALDGGRLALLAGESLTGRPLLSKKNEDILNYAGFALLMVLIVVLTYQDIVRLIFKKGFSP